MSGHIAAQIFATIGASESGKSYHRMRWVVEYFLPRPHLGFLVTNLPFDVEVVAEHFEGLALKGKSEVDGDDVKRRLKILARGCRVLKGLQAGDGSVDPSELLDGIGADTPCHIMLDEFHYYCHRAHSNDWKARWKEWLSTLRGGGTRFEMITQEWTQVPDSMHDLAAAQIKIMGAQHQRDGWFEIIYKDWYNLRAALPGWLTLGIFTGFWRSSYWVLEKLNFDNTEAATDFSKHVMWPEFFTFYQSNNASEDAASDEEAQAVGAVARANRIKEDWEVLSRRKVVSNFWHTYWRNLLLSRISIYSYLMVIALCGGLGYALNKVNEAGSSFLAEAMIGDDDSPKKGKQVPPKRAAPKDLASNEVGTFVAVPAVVSSAAGPDVVVVKLIDSDGVFLEGNWYAIGETVELGSADGETIESVDVRRGYGRFKSGRVFQLASRTYPAQPAAGISGAIPGLASVGSFFGSGSTEQGTSSGGNNGFGASVVGGGAVSGQPLQPFRGGQQPGGFRANQLDATERNSQHNSVISSPSGGRQSAASRGNVLSRAGDSRGPGLAGHQDSALR